MCDIIQYETLPGHSAVHMCDIVLVGDRQLST